MSDARHSIKAVVRRTGLSPHVIRIWEKRYGAVTPERTGTNRRVYSDEEVERLNLLREATHAGHSIGAIANLPTGKLRKIAAETEVGPASKAIGSAATPASEIMQQCLEAVRELNAPALEAALKQGSVQLGAQGLLQKLIAPLGQTIGELWRDGTLTAAHEHFATAVVRVFLSHAARSFVSTEGAPGLLVATPSGQLHELGALLAGAAAANIGWHVTYLGPSLPAAEIAGAALQNRARAVALSLVYPEDDAKLEGELTRLRELLPDGFPLLVGGRAAASYHNALAKVGALEIKDLGHLCVVLDDLRRPGPISKN